MVTMVMHAVPGSHGQAEVVYGRCVIEGSMKGGVNLRAVVLKSTVERSDGPGHQEKGAFGEDVWGDGCERNGL